MCLISARSMRFSDHIRSPLNNAFFTGDVSIIRLLLSAGADLDYRNFRAWTSVSYLWDPVRPPHKDITEILDMCMDQGFSAWNGTDTRGWSLVHRAAAYGCGADIQNLEYKGANLQEYTTDHMWGPMTCAVWNGNVSTFEALIGFLPIEEIVSSRDARGWTLLHFAAQNGCKQILRTLLHIGMDCHALTAGTKSWVTKGLGGKSLTAEVIAQEYGHGAMWAEAVDEVHWRFHGNSQPSMSLAYNDFLVLQTYTSCIRFPRNLTRESTALHKSIESWLPELPTPIRSWKSKLIINCKTYPPPALPQVPLQLGLLQ